MRLTTGRKCISWPITGCPPTKRRRHATTTQAEAYPAAARMPHRYLRPAMRSAKTSTSPARIPATHNEGGCDAHNARADSHRTAVERPAGWRTATNAGKVDRLRLHERRQRARAVCPQGSQRDVQYVPGADPGETGPVPGRRPCRDPL